MTKKFALLSVYDKTGISDLAKVLVDFGYEIISTGGTFEILKNDDLFVEPSPFAGQIFTVKKLTLGYVYEFLSAYHLKWGIGGLIDFPMVPATIKNCYGNTTSFMGFLQIRLV